MKPFISILLIAVLSAPGTTALAAEFHVATDGNDANPGTSTSPFASLERALEATRATPGKDEIRISPGTWFLTAPLLLDARDSGLRITGQGDVLISGGQRITGWQKSDGKCFSADLLDVKAGKWFFRQLFVDDGRATRARWPNADDQLHLASVSDDVKSFTFDRTLTVQSLAGQDSELVVFENWSITRGLLTSAGGAKATTATPMGWIGHGPATTASPGKPVYLEHARAFLDQPGEWFLDRKTGTLDYQPLDGQDPRRMVAVAPRLQQLLVIRGTREQPARDIRISGIRFEHTAFPLPEFGYNEIQAGHYGTTLGATTFVQPVAIEYQYARNCRIDRCRVAHIGASGIGFGAGCRNNTLTGCLIEDVGGNGVMVGWRGQAKLQAGTEGNLDADWADAADAPAGVEVSDCEIRRCGAFSQGCVGVFVAFSADTRIVHNLVHDLPYTGMSIGYRWNSTPTTQQRCLVEQNHIHDVMKDLADGGGIYTLGFQPGTVFRQNLIHDVHRSGFAQGGAPNNGFFIDEGSKGFLFEGNVVYATSGDAVRFNQNQRQWHTWTDNRFDVTGPDDEAVKALAATAGPRAPLPRFEITRPQSAE